MQYVIHFIFGQKQKRREKHQIFFFCFYVLFNHFQKESRIPNTFTAIGKFLRTILLSIVGHIIILMNRFLRRF